MNNPDKTPWPPVMHSLEEEPPTPETYSVFDNDLARDNIENDIPDADLEDIYSGLMPQLDLHIKPQDNLSDPDESIKRS